MTDAKSGEFLSDSPIRWTASQRSRMSTMYWMNSSGVLVVHAVHDEPVEAVGERKDDERQCAPTMIALVAREPATARGS
jgi:hypothetical protein